MNEKLRDRFDALSSSSDDKQLSWAAMEPAIQEALGEKKKKRRGLLWWWFGGASMLFLFVFFAYQFQSFDDDALTETSSASNTYNSIQDLAEKTTTSDPNTVSRTSNVQDDALTNEKYKDESVSRRENSALSTEVESSKFDRAFAKTSDTPITQAAELQSAVVGELLNEESSPVQEGDAKRRKARGSQSAATAFSSVARTEMTDVPLVDQSVESNMNAVFDEDGALTQVLPKGEGKDLERGRNASSLTRLGFAALELFVPENSQEERLKDVALPFVAGPSKDSEEENDVPAANFYLTSSGGALFSSAAKAYRQTEDFIGSTVGLGIEYELASGWYGGLGARMDQAQFSTRATLLDTIREYRPGQVEQVIRYSVNEIVLVYSDTVSVQLTRNVLHYNSQRDFVVPVQMGYRWKLGKWNMGLNTGANFIVLQRIRGKLLSNNREIFEVDQRSKKLRIMPNLGFELGYPVLKNWQANVFVNGSQSTGISTNAQENLGKFWASQVRFGLRYRLF